MSIETLEREAIRRVARVMLEEAAALPDGSRVAACYESAAEESLQRLDENGADLLGAGS